MTLKIVSFKIDENTLFKLDLIARETGIRRSEIIRRAIMLYLLKAEKEAVNKKPRIRVIHDA